MYFEGLLTDIIDSDRKMLMSMMTSEKLSHAYLFVSDSAINAENVCAEFLGMIMSDENSFENILTRIRNHNHTDVMHIYPDGSTVKIKQLRNVVPEFLQSSPTEASNRAVIIHKSIVHIPAKTLDKDRRPF